MPTDIPATQYAVQLVAPDKLELNTAKEVYAVGDHHVLMRVQAVGLCFSDLKLLHQFSEHPRKAPVVKGLDADALANLPSYRPGNQPTVPGHEAVCEIVAVGSKVTHYKPGQRVMVQADFRHVRTATTNGAFGYNLEGALQEYAHVDERAAVDPTSGQPFLMACPADRSASAIALVEPWACVENSYATPERGHILAGGRLRVVAQAGAKVSDLSACLDQAGQPAQVVCLLSDEGQKQALGALAGQAEVRLVEGSMAAQAGELADQSFDDIVYFGCDADTIEALNDKLAGGGVINVVTGGRTMGRKVQVGVGRVHYGPTRWVGTTGNDAAAGYARVPVSGEVRDGDTVLVVGAGGPMGQMHVIRLICSGKKNLTIVAADLDDERLDSLNFKAGALAQQRGVTLRLVNTKTSPLSEKFTYVALMAPVGQLVQEAIEQSADGCIVNIFAGIPAPTKHELDLDAYLARGVYMFGTSGSRIEDMKTVLDKVVTGQLDTNTSVDAVSGMAGAVEGIEAVKNRTMAGKIVVYPQLREMGLIPLHELEAHYPSVAAKLSNGLWTDQAEQELLQVAK